MGRKISTLSFSMFVVCFTFLCGTGFQNMMTAPVYAANEIEVDLSESGQAQETEEVMTFNLRSMPMEDFFELVSEKTGMSFMVKQEIKEMEVTAFMPDTRVRTALDAILTIYDLAAREIDEGIWLIDREKAVPFDPVRDMEIELIELKYIDADDIKTTIEPFLSEYGKIAVVEKSGYSGWEGEEGVGARRRSGDQRRQRVESNKLMIREKPELMERLRSVIDSMDRRAEQVLISAHIVEVSQDAIRDIGLDWDLDRSDVLGEIDFGAAAQPLDEVAMPGFSLDIRRIPGARSREMGAFLRIIEEEAGGDILSSPRMLTADRQECSIMVGERFPILLTDVDPETGQRTTSLDYYEDVGVQLNVLPRIQHNSDINLIVRPVISTQTDWVEGRGEGNILLARYPVIGTREAETQVSIESGQTIVIGGLIKEQMSETVRGVPLLQNIPLMGSLFRREFEETEKVDLLIFLSADIISAPMEASEERFREQGEGVVRVFENTIELREYPQDAGSVYDLTDKEPYNIGEKVTLNTEPNPGYEFVEWTGHTDLIVEGAADSKEIVVKMEDEDAWFTANYRLIDFNIDVMPEPDYAGRAFDRVGAEHYNRGDKARLKAQPEPGYEFSHWDGDVEHVRDVDSPSTLVSFYDRDLTIKGRFIPIDYFVTINAVPEDYGVVTDHTDGEPYHIGDEVQISAEPHVGRRFLKWTGDVDFVDDPKAQETTIQIPAGDVELTAQFEAIEYELKLQKDPWRRGNLIDLTDDKPYYFEDAVEVMALPTPGFQFDGWSGDVEILEDPGAKVTSAVMPAHDVTLQALYEPIDYAVTLGAEPEAYGQAADVTAATYYNLGDTVKIEALAEPEYEFQYWAGDIYLLDDPFSARTELIMPPRNVSMKAVFAGKPVELKIGARPDGYGSAAVEAKFEPCRIHDVVVLRAEPEAGYKFVRWEGDLEYIIDGDPQTQEVKVKLLDTEVNFNALFKPIEYDIILGSNPPVGGVALDISREAPYKYGDSVKLFARANAGYVFKGWSGDSEFLDDADSLSPVLTLTKVRRRGKDSFWRKDLLLPEEKLRIDAEFEQEY